MQQPVGEGEVGAGQRGEVQARRRPRWVSGAGRRRRGWRRRRGRRRSAAWPAASWPPGWSRRAARPAARATSVSGNGSPRSMPNALFAAVAAERHAEAAVVVDHRRAQRHPGELAERVRLLVRQPAAAEAADRVAAVRALRRGDRVDDPVERLVPGRRAQRARRSPGLADQRGEQPLRVVEQLGGGPALRAEAAEVRREVRLRLEPERAGHPRTVERSRSRTAGSSTGSASEWPRAWALRSRLHRRASLLRVGGRGGYGTFTDFSRPGRTAVRCRRGPRTRSEGCCYGLVTPRSRGPASTIART